MNLCNFQENRCEFEIIIDFIKKLCLHILHEHKTRKTWGINRREEGENGKDKVTKRICSTYSKYLFEMSLCKSNMSVCIFIYTHMMMIFNKYIK